MIDSITDVDHVGVGLKNMERMRAFYRDLLAFNQAPGKMPEDDRAGTHSLISRMDTQGLDVLLTPQGVDDPTHPAIFMYARDPDGVSAETVAGKEPKR